MCLIKAHKIPKIATKDIMVYKIVYEDIGGNLKTMMRHSPVKLNTTIKGKFKKRINLINSLFDKFIEDGFIHAYTNIRHAKCALKLREENSCELEFFHAKFRIVKCVIPKYTLYYVGKHYDIASRKLKYLE